MSRTSSCGPTTQPDKRILKTTTVRNTGSFITGVNLCHTSAVMKASERFLIQGSDWIKHECSSVSLIQLGQEIAFVLLSQAYTRDRQTGCAHAIQDATGDGPDQTRLGKQQSVCPPIRKCTLPTVPIDGRFSSLDVVWGCGMRINRLCAAGDVLKREARV